MPKNGARKKACWIPGGAATGSVGGGLPLGGLAGLPGDLGLAGLEWDWAGLAAALVKVGFCVRLAG